MPEIQTMFKGQFAKSPDAIRERLSRIKAFLFDWDGVFNNGHKHGDSGSTFSETDSMGLNMLRLGHWLTNDRRLPVAGIITGATNETAAYFTAREKLDVCIRGYSDKNLAWDHFMNKFDVQPEEVMFMYDDILDLPIAEKCGLRICVHRDVNPGFIDYVTSHDLVDYVTASEGGSGAVREAAELLLLLDNCYEMAVRTRQEHGDAYNAYLMQRASTATVEIVKERKVG